MKGWKEAVVLLVLILALAGILLVRTNGLPGANLESEAAAKEHPQSIGMLPESGETADENSEEPAPISSAVPEPTSTPTPIPTPKPLRPISLTDTDLPEELLRPAEHKGTVLEEDYPTRDMVSGRIILPGTWSRTRRIESTRT